MMRFKRLTVAHMFAALVLVLVMPSVSGAADKLNPEYGDPVFRPWSVFSPDIEDPKDYRDDVVVVLHGFRSALPNGTYKRIRKAFKKTHTTIGVNYDYFAPEKTMAFFEEVRRTHLEGRRVTVIGTSLGGFWALYAGDKLGAEKIVAINPVSAPERFLMKYAGTTQKSSRRAISFKVSASDVRSYGPHPLKNRMPVPTLLVLTKDDDRLDPISIKSFLAQDPNTTAILYETGGHTINLKKHPARDAIAAWVRGEG